MVHSDISGPCSRQKKGRDGTVQENPLSVSDETKKKTLTKKKKTKKKKKKTKKKKKKSY